MTEAEILELINVKRHTLEEYKSGRTAVSGATLKVLEDEIRQLESSLSKAEAAKKPTEQKVFLDECAG